MFKLKYNIYNIIVIKSINDISSPHDMRIVGSNIV
jgi:hypothetical protein